MSVPSSDQSEATPGSTIQTVSVTGHNYVREVKPLSGIEKAGFWLAIAVLTIALVYIILLFAMLFTKDFDASRGLPKDLVNNASDSLLSRKIELLKAVSDEKTKYREFIQQTSQTVLLNLLLPILTAIIGYIFGAKSKE